MLEQLADDKIICVKKPWSSCSDAQLVDPDERLAVPENVTAAGYSYFLEVHVAREVISVLRERPSSIDDKVRLLIEYAETDAYPEWVYE